MAIFRRKRKQKKGNDDLDTGAHKIRYNLDIPLESESTEPPAIDRGLSKQDGGHQTDLTSPSSSFSECSGGDHAIQRTITLKNTQITIEEPGDIHPGLTSASAVLDTSDLNVTFLYVLIREYPIRVGDNPSTVKGPAVTIGWDYETPDIRIAIDEYEKIPKRRVTELKMSASDRIRKLKEAGFSGSEIRNAVIIKGRARERRLDTARHLAWSGFHEKMEYIWRACLNATIRKAIKEEERKYLEPWKDAKPYDGPSTFKNSSRRKLTMNTASDTSSGEDEEEPLELSSGRVQTNERAPAKFTLTPQDSMQAFDCLSPRLADKRNSSSSFATSINMAGEVMFLTDESKWERSGWAPL